MLKKRNKSELDITAEKPPTIRKFYIFPPWRMNSDFPWPIWAVGWLAIFKALLWLATDPNIPDPLADILAAKFLIFMAPYVILGISVWNLKKWGAWALIVVTGIDLITYFIHPPMYRYMFGHYYWLLTAVLLICNGPIGNILILLASPVMLKHAGKND